MKLAPQAKDRETLSYRVRYAESSGIDPYSDSSYQENADSLVTTFRWDN